MRSTVIALLPLVCAVSGVTAQDCPSKPPSASSDQRYTLPPSIRSPADVKRRVDKAYPESLKDAGVGGTARVFFLIQFEGQGPESGDRRIE